MTIRYSAQDHEMGEAEQDDILVPISRSEVNSVIAALTMFRSKRKKNIERRRQPIPYDHIDIDQRHVNQSGAVLGRIKNLLGQLND